MTKGIVMATIYSDLGENENHLNSSWHLEPIEFVTSRQLHTKDCENNVKSSTSFDDGLSIHLNMYQFLT
jgi:alkylhydroperoxidase family enzyme